MGRRRKKTPIQKVLVAIRNAKPTASGPEYRALHEAETKMEVAQQRLKPRVRKSKDEKALERIAKQKAELSALKLQVKKLQKKGSAA